MRRSLRFLFLHATCVAATFVSISRATEPQVINPNGGWSWFGDERAVIDAERGVLYVGSLANRFGDGGAEKDGDVEVTRVELASGEATVDVLHDALLSYGGGDDHNVPSLLLLPDGRCLAAYTGHNNGPFTHFRTFDPQTQTWDSERTFNWDAAIPGGCDFGCTYNNLFRLPSTDQLVNISRNHQRSPNMIVSQDSGQTWHYAGQILRPSRVEEGTDIYVNGYLKYAQDGDRIHLLATEFHPRHYSTSIYHGYLENGVLHRTDGTVVDEVLDADPRAMATDLTCVFRAGTEIDGTAGTNAWMIDFEHYADGTLATIFKVRSAGSIDDHRFLLATCDAGQWKVTLLAKAGPHLFPGEEDYTGLAALDPNDVNTVYISTPIDPVSGTRLAHHEIFQGRSLDGGQSWSWVAITKDSKANNFRPIVPRWQPGRTALVWNRGTMTRSQNYDQEVVLLVDPGESE